MKGRLSTPAILHLTPCITNPHTQNLYDPCILSQTSICGQVKAPQMCSCINRKYGFMNRVGAVQSSTGHLPYQHCSACSRRNLTASSFPSSAAHGFGETQPMQGQFWVGEIHHQHGRRSSLNKMQRLGSTKRDKSMLSASSQCHVSLFVSFWRPPSIPAQI